MNETTRFCLSLKFKVLSCSMDWPTKDKNTGVYLITLSFFFFFVFKIFKGRKDDLLCFENVLLLIKGF